ncbi:hypothetical protein MS3_00009144 [Schistosoma haematobium]|uniref:PHD-type domain-containing protein n=1 Tax=Schistosoma haematobium TaxID=6185 RepID=A0A922LEA8_SCHHA|nr:hypothetical protein MS3_00009144 [Schistosoma haematobium]KAH9580516.1 hypothetical protein MS3_00009144 [Schistosoma haematobium]
MSFVDDANDPSTQLFIIEDLTPGYNRISDGSFQNDACRINNFSCRSADKQCCQQSLHTVSTARSPDCNQNDTTLTQRRQSARIEAKQKNKKSCCESEEEGVSEYCLRTKIPDGLTKQIKKPSPRVKINNSARKKRTKSRHSKQSQDLSNCSSDSEENDPERLWCICRQPHDERFMICCDLCDEWYHGDCVGIKPEEGKCMEKNEIEFVCDSCKLMGAYTGKNDQVDHLQTFTSSDNGNEFMSTQFAPIIDTSVSPTNLLTATIVNSLRLRLTEEAEKERDRIATILPETDIAMKCPSEDDSSVSESFSTLTSVEETPSSVVTNENKLSSVNNSCVVNNTNSLQSVNLTKVLSRRKKRPRIILKNEIKEQVNSTNSCLGPNCDKTINPQVSVYCSNRCLKAYGLDVLQTVCRKYDSTDPLNKSGHYYRLDGRKTLVVLDRRSGTVLNGTRAPTSDSLIDFLSAHPTFQVVYSRQKNDRFQKTSSLNQSNKCSGQNEGSSNVNKISSEYDPSRSPSSISSESNDKNNKQRLLTSENVERIRKKYQCLLFALLEKRTQTSRHIFTANRSRLKTLATELEGVISARNNLTNYSTTLDGSSPLAQDYSTYKCQLHLFLNCLDNPCISEKSNTLNNTTSTTESSVMLRDQFFDSLISGTLRPIDLAHCQDVKTLESIVRRTRLTDNTHNKLSAFTSSVSSNNINTNHSDVVYGSIPTSCTGIPSSDNSLSSDLHTATTVTTCQSTEITNTTTIATITNELPILDTTSEHGKHLYDMHCKRCTGQTKAFTKQSSQQLQQQLPKKSISSPSNSTTNVCDGLSTLSVKTEPRVSSTSSGEKDSPFLPSPVESLQTKVSVATSDSLPIQEAVKLSPNDYSTLKRTNYLEDTTNVIKCMDPRRKETNPLHSSFDQYTPKIKSNLKRLNDQSLFEPSTQDSSISTKPLNSFSHSPNYHPPSSGVSTGLLDLPLPPAQQISLHNKSSFNSQTNYENSYLLSNREKFNSKPCLLWSGMLSLSTQYSGREHMFSLEINVYPFGYIQPKILNYPGNNDKNEMIQWESLLIGKQTSLVVSRGVNLISLPVYLGQTLLDSTHPRELFALRVTPRTKQMSHIYKDIFNHLKEINACGSLEPRFQGINDCLLYPLIGNTHLKDILLPVDLLSKFQLTGCDAVVENQLLIILTRPINVTSNVENISHPLPSLLSSSSSPPILNPDQQTPSNTEEIAVHLPSDDKLCSPLFNSLSKDAYVPTPVHFNEEALSTENIKMENQTVETSSIDSVGDIDLRPLIANATINNVNQSLYPSTQQWFSSSTEDVDYRKLIPQPPIHPGCSTPQNVYNKSSPPMNNDYKSSHSSNRSVPRFREKTTYLSSSKRIYTIKPTNYQPVHSARHLLPDPVSRRNSCVTRSPLQSTNPLPVTINIQRSNPCALLPTPSIKPLRRPPSSPSLSSRRSSRRPSPRLSRSPRPVSSRKKPSVIVHSYNHHNKHRHSRFRH